MKHASSRAFLFICFVLFNIQLAHADQFKAPLQFELEYSVQDNSIESIINLGAEIYGTEDEYIWYSSRTVSQLDSQSFQSTHLSLNRLGYFDTGLAIHLFAHIQQEFALKAPEVTVGFTTWAALSWYSVTTNISELAENLVAQSRGAGFVPINIDAKMLIWSWYGETAPMILAGTTFSIGGPRPVEHFDPWIGLRITNGLLFMQARLELAHGPSIILTLGMLPESTIAI